MTESKDYWDRPSERYDPDFCANTYKTIYSVLNHKYLLDQDIQIFLYEVGYTKQCDHIVNFTHHRREIAGILKESTLQKIQTRDFDFHSIERDNLRFAMVHSKNLLLADTRWNRFSLFLKLKSLFSFHKK